MKRCTRVVVLFAGLVVLAAALSAPPIARADEAHPFVITGGVGPVYDAANDFGWSLRLAGMGHPGNKDWLQAGMEVTLFGRPEVLIRDETTDTPGGSRRIRKWETDQGSFIGVAAFFPFGFGALERKPTGVDDLRRGGRRRFEIAPALSGGMYLDSTTTSRQIVTEGSDPSARNERDEGTTHLAGGYAQLAVRARWSVLELVPAAQAIGTHPLQLAVWLGFNVPW